MLFDADDLKNVKLEAAKIDFVPWIYLKDYKSRFHGCPVVQSVMVAGSGHRGFVGQIAENGWYRCETVLPGGMMDGLPNQSTLEAAVRSVVEACNAAYKAWSDRHYGPKS